MLRTEIAAQEVEATGIEIEYTITGIQSLTCEIPYQAVPPAASARIYDDDGRQYFLGQVVRHEQDDDGRVQVEAWAMDYRLRRRQIYDEVTYTEQDGGAIIRDRLAPHEWADVSGVPTNLGTIASIPFVNTTDAKVIEEVAAICNVLAYWDMTTGIYRAHAVGARTLPDPLPEAITREIIWSVDESEVYNAIVARGNGTLIATLTDAARQAIGMTATQLQGCRIKHVKVTGLADARSGTAAANQSLSERRARSVAEALAAAGLPAPAFEVAAAGAEGAVVNGVNDPLRRRTEVVIEAQPRR